MSTIENPFLNLHMLVVDDEKFMRSLLVRLLQEFQVGRISEAIDGQNALEMIKNTKTYVDVILLDLEMPNLNGFEFIQEMKKQVPSPQSDIPVVVISGLGDEDAVAAVQALGIKLFLLKPVSRHALASRLNSAIRMPEYRQAIKGRLPALK